MKDCLKTVFFLLKKTINNFSAELKKTIILELFFQFKKTVFKNSFFGRGSIRAYCFFQSGQIFFAGKWSFSFFQSFSTQRLSDIRRLFFCLENVHLLFISFASFFFRAYLECSILCAM